MKATGTFPKCRLDRHAAAASPKLRPAPPHTPPRRPAAVPQQYWAADAPQHVVSAAAAPRAALVVGETPGAAPHVLHIDSDNASAQALSLLLTPEARVTHVPTLAAAREILRQQIFSAVVIDPHLPDGDAAELLPALTAIPLVVYSASQPYWRARATAYLPKPWTSPRRLWSTISALLGIPTLTSAGN